MILAVISNSSAYSRAVAVQDIKSGHSKISMIMKSNNNAT